MERASANRRAGWAGPLVAVAVVLAVLALVLSYFGRAVLEGQPFADRAVAALQDPAVQDDVADHLTDVVVNRVAPDLVTVRPLVRAVTGAVVGSKAFSALFRRAVLEAHASLVSGHGSAVVLTVADANVLIQGALERVAPDAARRVGAVQLDKLGSLEPGGAVLTVVRFTRGIYTAAWVLALIAAALALLGFWLSDNRRRTAERLGLWLALGGLVIAALYTFGGHIAGQLAAPDRSAAVAAVWRAFAHGLLVQALVVAGAGAVIAALSAAGEPTGIRAMAGAQLTRRAQAARALLLIVAGVVIVLEPGATVTLAVTVAGLALVYIGLRRLVAAVAPSLAAWRSVGRPVRRVAARLVLPVIAVVALAGAATLVAAGTGDGAAPANPATCNGYAALCDRPLNEVALAATHNSMASVTIPHWLLGQQDGTVEQQLDYGIRGLLIDSYYGFPVKGGVRTDLASLPKRDVAVQQIGEPAVKAAERIRARLGDQNLGKRQIYLCHGFCEIGAVTLSSTLAALRDYMVDHPDAVVVIINQDEGVPPTAIEHAFAKAGLLDLVYRGPLGPFPTLGQMIDSGQRLVVLAENDAGQSSWYRLAYKRALQETPYSFGSAAKLTDRSQIAKSCRPNRGPNSAPLFLLNNWVDTSPLPRASNAVVVNARGALLRRADTCERIRHRLPNLVAVDFYKRGDVLGVVRRLNRVSR